ncbi:MAG: VanZ family protein [Roseimicrobium sp.]
MLRRPRTWFVALALWFTVLFAISHQSKLHPPGPDFPGVDKVHHTAYFTLGGICVFLGLRLAKPQAQTAIIAGLTVAFCSACGVFDEVHQSFIPNRSGNDLGDWLADTLGGVLGALAGSRIYRRLSA